MQNNKSGLPNLKCSQIASMAILKRLPETEVTQEQFSKTFHAECDVSWLKVLI